MRSSKYEHYAKTLFLLISIVFWLYACSSNKPKDKINNDLKINNLNGHVKKLTRTSYEGREMKFGELQKGNIIQTITYSFNEKGYKVQDSMNNPYSENYYKTTYKYDKKGYLIEEDFFEPDNQMPTYKRILSYDNRNNLVENIYYNKEGILSSKIVYNYDGEGNRIESNFFTAEGGLSEKTIYKFEDGKMVEECSYKGNGSMMQKTTYKYDDNQNQVEECRYNPKGELSYKFTSKFNEYGIVTEVTELNQGLPYDSLNDQTIRKFDNEGNIIEENRYSLDGKLKTKYIYKYPKYDKEGNWLIKERVREICNIELADVYPNSLQERNIEYY